MEKTAEKTKTILPRRKPGPAPQLPTRRKYTVLLPEELGEWGKRRPGGLSNLTRHLLELEKERAGTHSIVLPTVEEMAADEAEMQQWYDALPPEGKEEYAERIRKGGEGPGIPSHEAIRQVHEYIRVELQRRTSEGKTGA